MCLAARLGEVLTSFLVVRVLNVRFLAVNMDQSEGRRPAECERLIRGQSQSDVPKDRTHLQQIVRVEFPEALTASLNLRQVNFPSASITVWQTS